MKSSILIVLATCVCVLAQGQAPPPDWHEDTINLFATLPIQEGGRVKPLDTYAAFKLLQLNGRRKCKIGESTHPFPLNRMVYPNRQPTEWLLDCLFHPEIAREYPMFLVENADTIVALGAEPLEEKRGRYTYNALKDARLRLFEMARMHAQKPEKELDAVKRQIIRLAENLHAYEEIEGNMAFVRHAFPIAEDSILAAIFPEQTSCRLSEVLSKAPEILAAFSALREREGAMDENTHGREMAAIHELFTQLDELRNSAITMALFPPNAAGEPWLTVNDVVEAAFAMERDMQAPIAWLAQLEAMAQGDPSQSQTHAAAFHDAIVSQAKHIGNYGTIELEVAYYRAKLFHRALILFILCFMLIAVSWLIPRNRILHIAAPVALLAPTLLLIAGITLRCVIRHRPPVTTLYETTLFVTAVVVLLALFVEYVNRQRIALALGGILGVFGMLLANKYEMSNAKDTMPSMVAVLDTNFWLFAHVTTIIIGYAASLLAGAMAHAYVAGKLLGVKKADPAFYKSLTRVVYGILCFGFFFTFVGTVLGGIWANESWGRFWGWDPKENGALLIVLWQLALLHARLGGYIRDLGVNLGAVFGAAVVAFSWWGVNLLGVGLHTYGFTSGTMNSLIAYWGFETFIIFLGAIVWFKERRTKAGS